MIDEPFNGETHVKEMPYIRTELYQCIITVDKITDLYNKLQVVDDLYKLDNELQVVDQSQAVDNFSGKAWFVRNEMT